MFNTLLFFLVFILLNNYSSETSTITRYILQGQDSDYFSYTDDAICGSDEEKDDWCKGKNAWPIHDRTKFRHRCTCQCYSKNKTFIFEKEECVSKSYLIERHSLFGKGFYLFSTTKINLQSTSSNFYMNKNCEMVGSVMYFMNSQWHEMPLNVTHLWTIKGNGMLSWPVTNLKDANGKILKIKLMNCTRNSNGWQSKDPLLFCKSKGNYSIIYSTASPSSTLAPTPILITSEIQMMSTSPTSEQTEATMYTTRTVIPQHISTSTTISMQPMSVIIHHPSTAQPRSNSLSEEVPTPVAAVVGSVVACVVVLGVIVFCFVWKRRKESSRHRPLGNAKVPPDSTGNPMYGQNQGDVIALPSRKCQDALGTGAEEYDYAAVDGVPSNHQKPTTPIYQSLIKENVRTSVYAALNEETPVQYSYNHLQHPQYNPPRSKSDPLYNTLGKPNGDVYMEPGTQITDNKPKASEPLYNVLEGPDGNPAPQDNDPVYNVLEDPDANQYPQDNDPVYNVLEGPDADPHPQDNDPVYNVLEDPDDDYDNAPSDDDQNLPASGQDNVAYSSTIDLKMPQAPSSPDYDVLEDPDGALPDSTYQPLGVRVQDDVYQPLDRTSQSIYQSLEPNDSTA